MLVYLDIHSTYTIMIQTQTSSIFLSYTEQSNGKNIKNIPPVICFLGLGNHSAGLLLPALVHVYYSGENNPFLPELYVTTSTIIMVFTCSQGKTWNIWPSILPYNIWKCHRGREPHQSLRRLQESQMLSVTQSQATIGKWLQTCHDTLITVSSINPG